MNLLSLVNRARQECGVSGGALTTVQGTLTQEGQRFKDWVNTAWTDIQQHRGDWQWMRKTATFNTVAGQTSYTAAQAGAPDVNEWSPESFRDYLASIGVKGEMFMTYRDFSEYRDLYEFNAMRLTQSRPVEITIRPDHSTLSVWPLPNDVYTITGEYYRVPTDLTLDTDDPASAGNDLPTRFHMLLIYMAMRSYAAYESAPEVDARGMEGMMRIKGQLEAWGLQTPQMGYSLA